MDIDARLEDVERRYDELTARMADPATSANPDLLRRTGKDLAELEAIVVPFRRYREARRQAEEARALAAAEAARAAGTQGPRGAAQKPFTSALRCDTSMPRMKFSGAMVLLFGQELIDQVKARAGG